MIAENHGRTSTVYHRPAIFEMSCQQPPPYDSDEDELEELGVQTELVEMLMEFYCHSDSEVLVAVVEAIDKVIKSLKKEAQVCIVPCLHKTLNKVVSAYKERIGIRRHDEVTVPAICEAKGIAPLMATYIQGLLNGTPEVIFLFSRHIFVKV